MQLVMSSACATPPGGANASAVLVALTQQPTFLETGGSYGGQGSFFTGFNEGVKALTDTEANELSAQGRLYDVLIDTRFGVVATGSAWQGSDGTVPAGATDVARMCRVFSMHLRPTSSANSQWMPVFVMPSKVGYAVEAVRYRRPTGAMTGGQRSDEQGEIHRMEVMAVADDGSGGVDVKMSYLARADRSVISEETATFYRVAHVVTPENFRGAFIGHGSYDERIAGTAFSGTNKGNMFQYGAIGAVPMLYDAAEFKETLLADQEYPTDTDPRYGEAGIPDGPEFVAELDAAIDWYGHDVDGKKMLRVSRPICFVVRHPVGVGTITPGSEPLTQVYAGALSAMPLPNDATKGYLKIEWPDEPDLWFNCHMSEWIADLRNPVDFISDWYVPTLVHTQEPNLPAGLFYGESFLDALGAQEGDTFDTDKVIVTYENLSLQPEPFVEEVALEDLETRSAEIEANPNNTLLSVDRVAFDATAEQPVDFLGRTHLAVYNDELLQADGVFDANDTLFELVRWFVYRVNQITGRATSELY